MAAKVVDASAVAALLFNETEAEIIAERFDGNLLLAPSIITYELSSVCLKKIRNGVGEPPTLLDALRRYEDLDIDERPVVHEQVVELANSTGLSAYDASYLWLSRHMDVELVTLDKKLARAASA